MRASSQPPGDVVSYLGRQKGSSLAIDDEHRSRRLSPLRFAENIEFRGRRIAEIFITCLLLCFVMNMALAQSAAKLEIKTLSSRPDLVSGGDALVEVRVPAGVSLNQLSLTLNGMDVTKQLKQSASSDSAISSFRGLIGGMVIGNNTLLATIKPTGKSSRAIQANLSIKNYPITGPILSGRPSRTSPPNVPSESPAAV